MQAEKIAETVEKNVQKKCGDKKRQPDRAINPEKRVKEKKCADNVICLVKRHKSAPRLQSQPSFDEGKENIPENRSGCNQYPEKQKIDFRIIKNTYRSGAGKSVKKELEVNNGYGHDKI